MKTHIALLEMHRATTSNSSCCDFEELRQKMFQTKTVLVLGAGASTSFGLPLGRQLYDKIISKIRAFKEHVARNRFDALPIIGPHNAHFFAQNPMIALAAYLSETPRLTEIGVAVPRGIGPGAWLIQLGEALAAQTHDSLDRFIHDNPEHRFLGKVLLAQHVILGMYTYDADRYRLRSFAERNVHVEGGLRRNWYHQLINLLREDAGTGSALEENKLQIVSFNYDLTLEQALEAALAKTTRHAGADWRKIVPIYHVNGAPQQLPDLISDVGDFLINCANQMRLIGEDGGEELAKVRKRACKALADSDRIFLMGFHADRANLDLIGLPSLKSKSGIFCLNFDGHPRVSGTLNALGVPIENIRSGTKTEPVHIDMAMDEGFLEREKLLSAAERAAIKRKYSGWDPGR